MVILVIYLGAHYIYRFKTAFAPSTAFVNLIWVIDTAWTHLKGIAVHKPWTEARQLSPESPEFKAKRLAILKALLMFNCLFLFLAFKLRDFHNSRVVDLYFIASLLYTFLLTVVIFAFLYRGLFVLDPLSFSAGGPPTLLSFLLFSFNTLLTAGYESLVPATVSAQVLRSSELMASILIFIILFFILTSVIREKYHKDVQLVIDHLDSEGRAIDGLLLAEHNLTLVTAEAEIVAAEPNFSSALRVLRGFADGS